MNVYASWLFSQLSLCFPSLSYYITNFAQAQSTPAAWKDPLYPRPPKYPTFTILPPGSFLDSALLYPHFWRLLSGSQSSIFPSLPLPTPTRFSPPLTRCRGISNPRKALGSVGGCRGEKWCRAFFLWVGRGLGNQSWRTQLGLQGSMDPRETVSLALERWAKHSQITKLGKHETEGIETVPGVSAMGQSSACIYSAFLGGLAAAIWRPPQAELRHSG